MWTLIIYFKQPYAVEFTSVFLEDLTNLDINIGVMTGYDESRIERIEIERPV